MPLPPDYVERVYAGVLGKLIGVYLGRPFEGWSYERIRSQLGEIWYYVHTRRDMPFNTHTLVVTDDDVTGMFTFLRALSDYGCAELPSAEQIGQTWLNYIIEGRTILWWGGLGRSTEHTAYLRLKRGISAPASGSVALNGRIIAEQIGAQIFIDGWAMVAPGDPALAAELARRAASVSHDGVAIHGAQLLAAMQAQAFVEHDTGRLLDCGLSHIPRDSLIARLIADVREWHARDGDWRTTRERIDARYGYDTYGGSCHIVPNHALIVLGLLYGAGDFQRALMIANTAGWDTDCNSGNLGCLLGIQHGLACIDAGPDWRGPVADRLYLPTADGGRAISDAVRESYQIVNLGRALRGQPPLAPKGGARFHFELPGSVQGFQPETGSAAHGTLALENVPGHSQAGTRSLALHYRQLATGCVARAATATFIPEEARSMPGYELLASPTLYPGQTVHARLQASAGNLAAVGAQLYARAYGPGDALVCWDGPAAELAPGAAVQLDWPITDQGAMPIAEIGVALHGQAGASGTLYLDYLDWDGTPNLALGRPAGSGTMWRRAWVNGVDMFESAETEPYRVIQNEGTGLLIYGVREWRNYLVRAEITPHLAAAAGIGARVQGMRRYYALQLCGGGKVRLVKAIDSVDVLFEADFGWRLGQAYTLQLEVAGSRLRAWIGERLLCEVEDRDRPLVEGAIALICQEGHMAADKVEIRPVGAS